MFVLSPLMMSAMHAVQWNHLRHHRHCMDDDDVEAMSAQHARLEGAAHRARSSRFACTTPRSTTAKPRSPPLDPGRARGAGGDGGAGLRRRSTGPGSSTTWSRWRSGQCFSAFFAVWTVHHDCDRDALHRAHAAQPAEVVRHATTCSTTSSTTSSRRCRPASCPSSRSASTRWRPSCGARTSGSKGRGLRAGEKATSRAARRSRAKLGSP